MDESEIYYTALILDHRVKGELILRELEDPKAGSLILTAIRDNLHPDPLLGYQADHQGPGGFSIYAGFKTQ